MKRVSIEESHYYIKIDHGKKRKADAFCLVPIGDGWDEVQYLANALIDPSGAVRKPEYVYVFVNKSVPNMVKIGRTTNTPDHRAKEVSKDTGVVLPWIPVYWFKCYRSDLLEADLHEYFKEQRVNPRREMFEIDSYTAQRVIEELGYKYSTALWEHNRL
jgi:hypothetical protein